MSTEDEMYDESQLDKKDQLRLFYERQDQKETIEQRDAIMDLKVLLGTNSGKKFMKFLIKSFEVGELPDRGVEGPDLHETIGFLRAGQSVFQLVSQANKQMAGQLLAEIQGEKYERISELSKIEAGQ